MSRRSSDEPRHARAIRAAIVVVPLVLNAAAGLVLGTVGGDLRPAATDAEIFRWNFGNIVQMIGLGALGAGVVLGIIEALRWPKGARRRRAVLSGFYVICASAIIFVVAWLIGVNFFALPTTG